MQNVEKRIGKMLEETERFKRNINWVLEDAQKKDPALRRQVLERTGQDLKSVFSKIRAYNLETRTRRKHMRRDGKPVQRSGSSQYGDVAVERRGRTYVCQAKAVSSAQKADVNKHLKKAFEQIFGLRGEVPPPDSVLEVRVALYSGKNPWPFDRDPTLNDFQTYYDQCKRHGSDLLKILQGAFDTARNIVVHGQNSDFPKADASLIEPLVRQNPTIHLYIYYRKQWRTAKETYADRSREGELASMVITLTCNSRRTYIIARIDFRDHDKKKLKTLPGSSRSRNRPASRSGSYSESDQGGGAASSGAVTTKKRKKP